MNYLHDHSKLEGPLLPVLISRLCVFREKNEMRGCETLMFGESVDGRVIDVRKEGKGKKIFQELH